MIYLRGHLFRDEDRQRHSGPHLVHPLPLVLRPTFRWAFQMRHQHLSACLNRTLSHPIRRSPCTLFLAAHSCKPTLTLRNKCRTLLNLRVTPPARTLISPHRLLILNKIIMHILIFTRHQTLENILARRHVPLIPLDQMHTQLTRFRIKVEIIPGGRG